MVSSTAYYRFQNNVFRCIVSIVEVLNIFLLFTLWFVKHFRSIFSNCAVSLIQYALNL